MFCMFTGKLIIRPFVNNIAIETPKFLERIYGDICRPIINLTFPLLNHLDTL